MKILYKNSKVEKICTNEKEAIKKVGHEFAVKLFAVLNLLNLISYNISSVLLPVRALLTLISTVLTYFAVKELFEIEDDAKAVKKFVLCMAIYEVVAFVFYLLGIYIY